MIIWLKIKAVLEVFKHFRNPFLVVLMRFGLKKMPFFLYRIRNGGRSVEMLARPANASLGDLFVLRELFIEETYRDILPLVGRGPLSVLDVGANLGSFTVWLNAHRGVSRAYCFEPEPTSFQLCRFNLFNNGVSGAVAMPAAMGGQRRRLSMQVGRERPGGLSIYGGTAGTTDTAEVDVLAFHEWMQGVEGHFDVLKMDCEGAEWEILDHAPRELFSRFSVIVAEVHAVSDSTHDVSEFPKLMEERGFTTVRWDGHSHGVYIGKRSGGGAR